MVKSTIITNPVNLKVTVSKAGTDSWKVSPAWTAFPTPEKPQAKHIIFILDTSSSMLSRLPKVIQAVSNLLDKLTPGDTFSILSFNSTATLVVNNTDVSSSKITAAKTKLSAMTAAGSTSFTQAFTAVNTFKLISSQKPTSIIFLTDGEDHTVSAQALWQLFRKKKSLRIIPIGILEHRNALLDSLATLSGGGERALYIQNETSTEYQNAFDIAFTKTIAQSQTPAQLDMTIQARDKTNSTLLSVTRTLNRMNYDGVSDNSTAVYFNSALPPNHLRLNLRCDDRLLQVSRKLTLRERSLLEQNGHASFRIPSYQWKNNSIGSWVRALGNIVIGLLILSGVILFLLSFPQLSIIPWQSLAIAAVTASLGLIMLLCGVLAIARKTVLLPTTLSAEAREQNVRAISTHRFFSPALAGSLLAVGGASAGYYVGTQTFASSLVLATGISPFLFMSGCAVGSAIVFPLLIYGCIQASMQPLTESTSFVM